MQITETTIDKAEVVTEFKVERSEQAGTGTATAYRGEQEIQNEEQVSPDGKVIAQSTGEGKLPEQSGDDQNGNGAGDGEYGWKEDEDSQPGEPGEQGTVKDPNEAFRQAISQMSEDQKMDFLSNLPPIFTEDQIRRIAYAVFKEEYSGISQEIEIFTSRMKNSMEKAASRVLEETRGIANEMTKAAKAEAAALLAAVRSVGEATRIEVELKDGTKKDLGAVHRETEWLIKLLQKPRNVFLTGPAGSGKTTCAEKVAEALGLSFHPMSVGPETMKSDLLGFIDANGNYHTTQVREAFEKGGLLLIDEIDAGNGASMTILNSLLSNGYCSFPDGVVKRHPNFRCIAAANTFGRGADRLYVGRNQLDAATLDRFVVRAFDYDEDLERRLAGNDEWVRRVQQIRARASELKLRVVVSPRSSIIGADMLADGFSREDVEESCIFKYDKEFERKMRD